MIHAVLVGGLDQRLDHGPVGRGGAEHEVRHDLVERGAGGLAAILAAQVGIDRKLDRLEHRDRHLREPAPPHLLPLDRRLNGVASRPSMRTGITMASDLSAIRPAPS